MRVFVIGGTGFLGRNLVPRLVDRDHDVIVLTRDADKKKGIEELGASWVVGDILRPDAFLDALKQIDLIIFIAMPPVKPGRITKKQFRKLQAMTTNYFSNSIDLAVHCDCPIILTSGANYDSHEEKVFSERDPIQRFGMAKIGEKTDKLINNVLESKKPQGIVMMPGQIYGPGGIFLTMYRWIKSGKYKIVGTGNNYVPRVYVDDLADAYVKAIEKMPLGEKFIVADDSPCTVNCFVQEIARQLKRLPCGHVPGFIVRLVAGKLAFQTITMNCKVSNEKAKKTLNWRPAYSYKDGIRKTIRILESWSKT